ncbi:hypothetical protein [Kozakia baliensis]|uniref:hypothetical protein n=1 Tax=Kozakia baliensis TaxID=153496 RepID=UPI00049652E2|nr:hypothetical protein [Kozakia baliensis]
MPRTAKAPWSVKGAESAIDDLLYYHLNGWEEDANQNLHRRTDWTDEQKDFRGSMTRIFAEIVRIQRTRDKETANKFAADIGKEWKVFMASFGG